MRHPNWPEQLAALLAVWRSRAFMWGQTDCAHFALAVIGAVRGPAALTLPPYGTARQARQVLQSMGVRCQSEIADRLLGPRVSAAQLARGDLALLSGNALGVCDGAKIWAMSKTGLTALPRAQAREGWRV